MIEDFDIEELEELFAEFEIAAGADGIPDPGPEKYDAKKEDRKRELMRLAAFYAEEGPMWDPEGKYLCGSCYYRVLMDWGVTPACYIVEGKISMEVGSCQFYRHGNPDAESNPLPVKEKYTKEASNYAERPKKKGFGCYPRCEYGAVAEGADPDGREIWCGQFGVHVRPKACCAFEGGEDLVQIEGVGTSEGAEKGWDTRGRGRPILYHLTEEKNLKGILKNGIKTEKTGAKSLRKGWDKTGNAVYAIEDKAHVPDLQWTLENPLNPNNKVVIGKPQVLVAFHPAGRVRVDQEYDDYDTEGGEPFSARIHSGPVPASNIVGYYKVGKDGKVSSLVQIEAGGPGSGCNPEVGKCGRPAGPEKEEIDYMKEKIGEQQGTNPGGTYKGSDGVDRYVKLYGDSQQPRGEHLANQVYKALNVPVKDSVLFKHDGKDAIGSVQVEGKTVQKLGAISSTQARAFLNGFAADVLTANWDAVGTGMDNVLIDKAGDAYRIDNGGSFLKRAKGGDKPESVLNQITEVKGFLSDKNVYYRNVAKTAAVTSVKDLGPGTGTKSFADQVSDIVKLRDDSGGWQKFVESKIPDMPPEEQKKIVGMMDARTNLMQSLVLDLAKTPEPAKPTEAPIDISKTPIVWDVKTPEVLKAPPKVRDWSSPSAKLVAGFFRKGTVVAQVYTKLSENEGQWQKISEIKKELEAKLGKPLYNISQNTLKQGGKKSSLWTLEISGDNVRIFLAKPGTKPHEDTDVKEDMQKVAGKYAQQAVAKQMDVMESEKMHSDMYKDMDVPVAASQALDYAVRQWTASNNHLAPQNWRQVAMEYYGRLPNGEYTGTYPNRIGTPEGTAKANIMRPAVMAMKAYASEYARLHNVNVVYRSISGQQAQSIIVAMREAEAKGLTQVKIANNAISAWTDRHDLGMSGVLRVRMKIDPDNVWAVHQASPHLFTAHKGEREWMVGTHNPQEIFDFKDINVLSSYGEVTSAEYSKWHKEWKKGEMAAGKQTGPELDIKADKQFYEALKKAAEESEIPVAMCTLDDHWMYRKEEEQKKKK
jgi:hypothetical protein